MLADVLAAALERRTNLGRDTGCRVARARPGFRIPGGGQGAAVEAALREIGPGPVLVVNSDLPSADR